MKEDNFVAFPYHEKLIQQVFLHFWYEADPVQVARSRE